MTPSFPEWFISFNGVRIWREKGVFPPVSQQLNIIIPVTHAVTFSSHLTKHHLHNTVSITDRKILSVSLT